MLEVTIINILALLLAYYSTVKRAKQPLIVPCFLLALFFSLRYNYTMDYRAYASIFRDLNMFDNMDYSIYVRRIEIGWKLLNRLFSPLGFQVLVAATTFFQIGTFHWFVSKYVKYEWRWIMLFFYVVDPWYLLMGLSAMRQTVALSILMLAMPSVFKRDIIKGIILWVLALMFHKSAIVAFPILFTGYLNQKYWKWVITIEVALILGALLIPHTYVEIVTAVVGTTKFESYNHYMRTAKSAALTSGVGMLFRLIFVGYIFGSMRKMDNKMFIFAAIYAFSPLFSFMGFIGTYFGRLGWYFTWIGMPALMIYLQRWKVSLFGRALFICFCIIEVWTYYKFFTDFFPEGYEHFRSIITL